MQSRLQKRGQDVGHEKMGPHGIVCGFFVWGLKGVYPGDYEFEHTFRLVRDPLKTAETLAIMVPSGDYPWDHTDPTLRALRYWVLTHSKIPGTATVIRLAHIENDWVRIAQALNISEKIPDGINRRRKRHRVAPITWEEWKKRDPDWARLGEAHYTTLMAL